MNNKPSHQVRFDEVRDYMAALTKSVVLPSDDTTVVIDVGELEFQFRHYQGHLDDLLEIPPIVDNHDLIASKLGNIHAAASSIKMVCDDLDGSLDHLMSSLCGED